VCRKVSSPSKTRWPSSDYMGAISPWKLAAQTHWLTYIRFFAYGDGNSGIAQDVCPNIHLQQKMKKKKNPLLYRKRKGHAHEFTQGWEG
jgi:hypothetical protein